MRTFLVGALLLLGTLFATAPAHAQSEGIHVQGVWTIEVVNPDGSIAQRETFENALTNSRFLLEQLRGEVTYVLQGIELDPCPVDPAPPACRFELSSVASDSIDGGTPNFPVLIARAGLEALLPSGPVDLDEVSLTAKSCPPSIGPAECFAAPLGSLPVGVSQPRSAGFTRKTLDTPITINDGQTVNIEVRVSMN